MMLFDSEITFPGNGLCNVARSEIDLQKKRSLPLQHLHTIVLLQASLIRNQILWHEVKFIKNIRIVSWVALKGSESREFNTPAVKHHMNIQQDKMFVQKMLESKNRTKPHEKPTNANKCEFC